LIHSTLPLERVILYFIRTLGVKGMMWFFIGKRGFDFGDILKLGIEVYQFVFYHLSIALEK